MKKAIRKKVSKSTVDSLFADGFSLVRFYENAARECGLPVTEETTYDCREILVAPNIMACWYRQCEEIFGKGSTHELTRFILLYGPKSSEMLEDGEIEVEQGFVKENGRDRYGQKRKL